MGDASDTNDAREALTSRTIPQMTLSTALNPLTAPLAPLPTALTATERALARFGIVGNAVLTGGAGTLALASARALLEHGLAHLALLDLPTTLTSSASAIEALRRDFSNATILTVPVNVTDEGQVADAMAAAHAGLGGGGSGGGVGGGIDMLCCFAGVVGCVASVEASAAEFKRVVDVNLTGSFLCAQAAARYMIPSSSPSSPSPAGMNSGSGSGGAVLFISSISAHSVNFPQPQTAYNVSKAGVVHLTRCLAAEWAVHGIRVNCISPGYMDTVLNAGQSLGAVRDVWASRCPMGRMGDVEELTGAVVMLCGRRSGRYITGTDLVVDGGAICF